MLVVPNRFIMVARHRNSTPKINLKLLKEGIIKHNAMLVVNPVIKKDNDEFTIDINLKSVLC